ncbi:AvrD family protein [Rhodococcus sp. G-MC3]|uniref:AvrD family protein n=1 Tax=Rhodococcus sp. G-MC3 TaxID=3046209 RepID=UPI0024B8DAF4|nr:AvrD family protein [Rhodococcus sp. G-MC3]MDJ0396711.1 AvrD family protein [Rhodococcus sp. G-MC3]
MSAPIRSFAHVDDALGPAATRFFGHGYRRVGYGFGAVECRYAAASETVETTLQLEYPSDWSKKKASRLQRPHLSSLDAIVVGVQIADAVLTHWFRLDSVDRSASWIREIHIKAGSAPQEDLAILHVTGTVIESTLTDSFWRASTIAVSIGSMHVRLDVVHPSGHRWIGSGNYHSLDALLGEASRRYYGTGFADRTHELLGVRVDTAEGSASGSVRFSQTMKPTLDGVEGRYQPAASPIDVFVANLQLGQVLLYELDGVGRSESNTLWMRSATITTTRAPIPLSNDLFVYTALQDSRILTIQGDQWRTATLVGALSGLNLTCKLTHKLARTPLQQPAGGPT